MREHAAKGLRAGTCSGDGLKGLRHTDVLEVFVDGAKRARYTVQPEPRHILMSNGRPADMLTGEGSEQWVNDVCVTDALGAPNGVARSIESPGEVTEAYATNKKVRPFMTMGLAGKYRFRALALDSFGGKQKLT